MNPVTWEMFICQWSIWSSGLFHFNWCHTKADGPGIWDFPTATTVQYNPFTQHLHSACPKPKFSRTSCTDGCYVSNFRPMMAPQDPVQPQEWTGKTRQNAMSRGELPIFSANSIFLVLSRWHPLMMICAYHIPIIWLVDQVHCLVFPVRSDFLLLHWLFHSFQLFLQAKSFNNWWHPNSCPPPAPHQWLPVMRELSQQQHLRPEMLR